MPKNTQKYLDHYCEPEVSVLANMPSCKERVFDDVLIIPAYDETEEFIENLCTRSDKSTFLLILVINQPTNTDINSRNNMLFHRLINSENIIEKLQNIYHLNYKGLTTLLIDRYTKEWQIPKEQGVGLARKIGCDLACFLQSKKTISSKWIYSSDADAKLPDNYFDKYLLPEYSEHKKVSACIFEFHHSGKINPVTVATEIYEKALRYYTLGLTWANSPYAYHSLGSILAIKHEAYCATRGFPKKSAGEDFYLLNKLAKVGEIATIPAISVQIESRTSDRVPFGTGPAVAKIMASQEVGEDYKYYDWAIFCELKQFISAIREKLPSILNDAAFSHIDLLQDLSEASQAASTSIGIDKFFAHGLNQCRDEKTLLKAFDDWFDAFKTLKFIHYLQNHYFPPIPLKNGLENMANAFDEQALIYEYH